MPHNYKAMLICIKLNSKVFIFKLVLQDKKCDNMELNIVCICIFDKQNPGYLQARVPSLKYTFAVNNVHHIQPKNKCIKLLRSYLLKTSHALPAFFVNMCT